ncbi:MAG TPA: 1,4-alpha-glucan branching protein GlgB [Gammaproteobacteria bacterium]
MPVSPLTESLLSIIEARHHDPFAVLGRHREDDHCVVRVFLPEAQRVSILGLTGELPMERLSGTDLFLWQGEESQLSEHYQLVWDDRQGATHRHHDPYAFAPLISDFDLYLYGEGKHRRPYRFLGANRISSDGIDGILFAVWAPNAKRVSVVGDFNRWDGRCHPMRSRGSSGIWELFIPGMDSGTLYKFELRHPDGSLHLKSDPWGRCFELRPATAALVESTSSYSWGDGEWLAARRESDWLHAPMSIYEVHLGSWQRRPDGSFMNYRELAEGLVRHVKGLGFTHIELLPVTEHPFDGSWGYQTTGYFAPTSRFGSPDDFRYFVDHCHRNDVGVLLDWVPAHFPRDAWALARFDGTALYEHEDPRRGEHRDWGTLIFNYGRNEVRNFLIASALYWLDEFHIDGLRVDAVASMLYLDYSRQAGDWLPNVHGGRENIEAIEFLRELNALVHEEFPGALTMAEESTAWPGVSRPAWSGGLGFSMKWNMGWMHDTLSYMHKDPIHRRHHHNHLTFGLLYAFSENFILPFSHDEVVHMKRSLLDKMPGDEWQRFANLRLLFTLQYTMPGKKLLFMGAEFAQGLEWNHDRALEWHLYDYPLHHGVHTLLSELNLLHVRERALHGHDFDAEGFAWLDCTDTSHSLLSFVRRSAGETVVVLLNFTPRPRPGYRLGVPDAGRYQVIFNSDSAHYGGSNSGSGGELQAQAIAWMERSHSLLLDVPPLAGVMLRAVGH